MTQTVMFSFKYADLVKMFNLNNFTEVVVNYGGEELQVVRKGTKFDFYFGNSTKAQILWIGDKKLAFTGMFDTTRMSHYNKCFLINKAMIDNDLEPDTSFIAGTEKFTVAGEIITYTKPTPPVFNSLATMTSEELREMARAAVAELEKRKSSIKTFLIELER